MDIISLFFHVKMEDNHPFFEKKDNNLFVKMENKNAIISCKDGG